MVLWRTVLSLSEDQTTSTHRGTKGRCFNGMPAASASRYGRRSALAGSWMLMFLKRNAKDSPCRSLTMALSADAACVISGAVIGWRGWDRAMLTLMTDRVKEVEWNGWKMIRQRVMLLYNAVEVLLTFWQCDRRKPWFLYPLSSATGVLRLARWESVFRSYLCHEMDGELHWCQWRARRVGRSCRQLSAPHGERLPGIVLWTYEVVGRAGN